jgi:chemotaxis protein methyltransferase CheR
MPEMKRVLLEARLQKRLRVLGLSSFREYCDLLFNHPDGEKEVVSMIDAVTTNKTDFFREPVHFTYLSETVVPQFMDDDTCRGRTFSVWSAGCSTGEEPYTLAIVLSEVAALYPGFQFSILGTDISTQVLEKAKLAIYDEDRVAPLPPACKKKYLLRSKDKDKRLVRIVPEIRTLVRFQRLNLMDSSFSFSEPVDIIFCRNVIIYFDRSNQELLLRRLCRWLRPGGYLFLGHSETIHGFEVPLTRTTSTVYRKVL